MNIKNFSDDNNDHPHTPTKKDLKQHQSISSRIPGKSSIQHLKLDLDILEEDLTSILGYFEEEGHISREDWIIILKKETKMDQEDNIPETQSEENADRTDEHDVSNSSVDDVGNLEEVGHKDQLSEKEQKSLEIIREVVDGSGNISRTFLEGTLLYGELKLNNISMYNLVTSLENKGILKKIQLTDGEYYHFTP